MAAVWLGQWGDPLEASTPGLQGPGLYIIHVAFGTQSTRADGWT